MTQDEIRAIALEVKGMTYPDWNVNIDRYLEEFATRFLAAIAEKAEAVITIGENESVMCRTLPNGMKLFAHPAIEPAPQSKRHPICEELGCSGLDPDMCNNHPERCHIVQKVTKQPLTEPAPQQMPLGDSEGTATSAVCAAPLPDEVAQMVERLRAENEDGTLCEITEATQAGAADMIEHLARQVPPDCVVVPREPTSEIAEAWNYACRNQFGCAFYEPSYKAMIAAGEVKP